MNICVLGGGSFGTALAHTAARAGHDVCVWTIEEAVEREINEQHTNSAYLDTAVIHEGVSATVDLDRALRDAEVVVCAVPSTVLGDVAAKAQEYIPEDTAVVNAAKGAVNGAEKPLALGYQLLSDAFGEARVAVLSGPNFAHEMVTDVLTGTAVAASSEQTRARVARAFTSETFRVHESDDVVGADLCGVLKNVYAIAFGLVAAQEVGSNTTAWLFTESLAEIEHGVVAWGGKRETVTGLAGLGDLLLTATSPNSRNFSLGFGLGEGRALTDVREELGTVEGLHTLDALHAEAARRGVSLPIATSLWHVVHGELAPAVFAGTVFTQTP